MVIVGWAVFKFDIYLVACDNQDGLWPGHAISEPAERSGRTISVFPCSQLIHKSNCHMDDRTHGGHHRDKYCCVVFDKIAKPAENSVPAGGKDLYCFLYPASSSPAKTAHSVEPASIVAALFLFLLSPRIAMRIPRSPPAVNAPNPRNSLLPGRTLSKPAIRSLISSPTPISIRTPGKAAAML